MTVRIIVKDEEGKKIISRITSRYIEALHAAPFYWKGNEFIILGTQVEQSVLDAIIEEAGKNFFEYFDVRGYVTVGSWLHGRIMKAKDYIKERLGGE